MAHDNQTEIIMDQIAEKVNDIEDLMLGLPIRANVKSQLLRQLDEFYQEVNDALELSPVDW
jgi:hypothetical protein